MTEIFWLASSLGIALRFWMYCGMCNRFGLCIFVDDADGGIICSYVVVVAFWFVQWFFRTKKWLLLFVFGGGAQVLVWLFCFLVSSCSSCGGLCAFGFFVWCFMKDFWEFVRLPVWSSDRESSESEKWSRQKFGVWIFAPSRKKKGVSTRHNNFQTNIDTHNDKHTEQSSSHSQQQSSSQSNKHALGR